MDEQKPVKKNNIYISDHNSHDSYIMAIKNNNIFSIGLTCNDIYNDFNKYKEILEAIKINTSITKITITYNYNVLLKEYDEWSSILCDLLKINTTILHIEVFIYNISFNSLKFLFDGLSTNTSITKIYIYIQTTNPVNYCVDYYKMLSDVLKINSCVTDISIGSYDINVTSWLHLIESLKVNKTLKKFRLRVDDTKFNGCGYLNEVLLTNNTINYFDLQTDNMINLEEIIDAIEQNSNITYISIENANNTTVNIRNRLNNRCDVNAHNIKLKTILLQDL
jgi:hypothetical protein